MGNKKRQCLIQAGEVDDAQAFDRNLAQKVPQHEEALMTITQQLEQKGIEKGIQLGEQKGLEKGMQISEQKGFEKGLQLGEQKVRGHSCEIA